MSVLGFALTVPSLSWWYDSAWAVRVMWTAATPVDSFGDYAEDMDGSMSLCQSMVLWWS